MYRPSVSMFTKQTLVGLMQLPLATCSGSLSAEYLAFQGVFLWFRFFAMVPSGKAKAGAILGCSPSPPSNRVHGGFRFLATNNWGKGNNWCGCFGICCSFVLGMRNFFQPQNQEDEDD